MNICTLYDLFECTAKKYVSKPAVCFKTECNSLTISYQDLLSECERISSIIKSLGIKNGYIGVHLEQLLLLPAVILGILQSGLAFVFLNVDSEFEKLHVIKHLNIHWIISDSHLPNRYWICRRKITILNNSLSLYEDRLVEELKYEHNHYWIMAYAIKTSGTTGKPKIVKVPHRCIVPNIQNLRCLLSIVNDDIIFLTSPPTFDPSIIEIFLALTSGALLLIVPNSIKRSPSLLLKLLNNVTILEATPSFLKCWSKDEIQEHLLNKKSSLRVLLIGGEECPTIGTLNNWKMKGNNTDIFNVYGITEVSCWASIHKIILAKETDINEDLEIPLGNALSSTILKVKDELSNDIVDGEGELFIGSKERVCFIDDETVQNIEFPVFRATGDIVKIDGSNNKIVYIGRKNNVIKRFGHRVSLDKINNFVNQLSSVAQGCCIWNEEIKKLGLFLRPEKCRDDKNFQKDIREYLIKNFHRSHVPDIFITVDSIPLTSHGKVDCCKLKHLMKEKIESNIKRCIGLGSDVDCFSSLWSWYLCLADAPGPDDNFMLSGGNSIVAVQLISDLNEVLGISSVGELVGMLLGPSTFKECCAYLLSRQNKTSSECVTVSNRTPADNKSHDFTLKRKSTDKIIDKDYCNKIINMGLSNSSNKLTNDTQLLFSICRGRIEIGNEKELPICEVRRVIDFNVKWSFNLGKCIDASPRYLLHKNGKAVVCVGSHSSQFVAVDSRNGKLLMKCNLKDRIESSVCSSICGNIGVVGCYDGYIYGINLNSGVTSWAFETEKVVKSSPALCLDGTAVVVGSYDHTLYCINIFNGHLIWSNEVGCKGFYASPCVSEINKIVYVATLDGTCAAVDERTGAINWKCKVGSPVFSSPGIMPNQDIVIFAEVLGPVHFFSAVSGEKLWNIEAGGNIFSSLCIQPLPVSASSVILFGCHDEHVYCLEHSFNSITLKWKCKLDSPVFATPQVFPTKQQDGSISYKAAGVSSSGLIYIMDINSGKKMSSFQLPGEVYSSPVVYGNEIYVGCRDDKIYCLCMQ